MMVVVRMRQVGSPMRWYDGGSRDETGWEPMRWYDGGSQDETGWDQDETGWEPH